LRRTTYNIFRYVGLRHLKSRPARALLTTAGVACGTALFVAIGIINRSALSTLRENVELLAGKATVSISAGEAGVPERLLDRITGIPGVQLAVPVIESRAYLGGEGSSETLTILGIDLLKDSHVRTYRTSDERVIDDPLTFFNQADSLILSREFAARHGLREDSTLELVTARGPRLFTIRGLLTPEGPAKAYDGAVGIMDIDGAQASFGKEGRFDRVELVTAPNAALTDVISRVRERLGEGYLVQYPEGRCEATARMVDSFQAMLTLFSTLGLVVGLFLVASTVSISVAERQREIGTLRALGATRGRVFAVFLSEAFALGALGAAAGAWAGRGLANALETMVVRAINTQFLIQLARPHLGFGAGDLLFALGVGCGCAVLAAVLPAARAMRVEPVEAMRTRVIGTGGAESAGLHQRAFLAGLALMAYFALAAAFRIGHGSAVAEAINRACALLGPALAGPAVLLAMIRVFDRAISGRRWTLLSLASRGLLGNPARTAANGTSLLVGLIFVIWVTTINVSLRSSMSSWWRRALWADLVVSSSARIITFDGQPIHEELGELLSQVPGVARMAERTGAAGLRFVHASYEGKQVGLAAYDEPDPSLHYSTLDVVDRPAEETGRELYHSPDPVVLVSTNFAGLYGRRTGDSIRLMTPAGLAAFRVVGVVRDFMSPQGLIYMARDQYKRIWGDRLLNSFWLKVLPGYDPRRVREEVDRRFGRKNHVVVLSNGELNRQLADVVDQAFASVRAIEVVALAVALLGLMNSMLISVLERTRELGMMRAVGMSRGQAFGLILRESLIQGVLGAALAIALGAWICYLWIENLQLYVFGWLTPFVFPWSAVTASVAAALAVSSISGLVAARRAVSLEIRDALDRE
jgi:putative ABC transport system permease protein